MILRLNYLLLVFTVIFVVHCKGQTILRLHVTDNNEALRKLNYQQKHSGFITAEKELENVITSLQYQGYLLASADSVHRDSLLYEVWISSGQKYTTARLKIGNLGPDAAARAGISEKLFVGKPFNYREVARGIEKIIRYYENNGYPFVSVKLDSVQTNGNSLSAVFALQRNKLYKLDSIKIAGDAKINLSYLRRYLGIREGMPYNEELIAAAPDKLRQLPFLLQTRPQRMQLTERSNKLILFLDKKNASQFDGIIGLLPDANTKKTVITGDIKLKIINGILRNGETFDVEWRRLQSQTQDFNGRVIYPFLLKTPIGIDYAIKIYRKDTTFTDVNNNLGLQYYFSGLSFYKVYYKQRASNLVSTSGLDQLTALPDYADISTNSYGAGIYFEKLDYRFNPHKGILLQANAQTGTRQIKKNPAIPVTVYDDLTLKSTQYQFDLQLASYFRLKGNHVLKFGLQAASVFGDQSIFRNELLRIGGLKTLRGFDEESIYTSAYIIPTLEYRFLFARNSNLLLFAEGAWYENNSNHQYISDTPVSVGAGVNFETKAGILSLNYGLGNQFGNGFDLRNGKIHFGLTALF